MEESAPNHHCSFVSSSNYELFELFRPSVAAAWMSHRQSHRGKQHIDTAILIVFASHQRFLFSVMHFLCVDDYDDVSSYPAESHRFAVIVISQNHFRFRRRGIVLITDEPAGTMVKNYSFPFHCFKPTVVYHLGNCCSDNCSLSLAAECFHSC